jgi:short-subunit dehydrogenase
MHKRLDILINNAGIYTPGRVSEQSADDMMQMISVNLMAAWQVTQWALPLLRKGYKPLIINIGSIAGLNAYTNGGAYSVSKFALVGYSKNLRAELMESGIRVSTLNPGATWSSSWSGSRLPKSRLMPAEDIAELCALLYQLSANTVVEEIVMRPLLGDVKEEEF